MAQRSGETYVGSYEHSDFSRTMVYSSGDGSIRAEHTDISYGGDPQVKIFSRVWWGAVFNVLWTMFKAVLIWLVPFTLLMILKTIFNWNL